MTATTELIPIHDAGALARVEALEAKADALARLSLSRRTLYEYVRDWAKFAAWAEALGETSMPADPGTLRRYVAELAGRELAPSTISRALAAIDYAHKAAGLPRPERTLQLEETIKGAARAYGKPTRQAPPLPVEDLARIVAAMGAALVDVRDRALLLVGFAGGFRRSELVGLDLADLNLQPAGVVITVRRSKTDQEGRGRNLAVPYGRRQATCPVTALTAWVEQLRERGVERGPVFRSFHLSGSGKLLDHRLPGRDVTRVLQRRAAAVGLDPARFSAHSLRSGLATAAAQAGVEERVIAQTTGHQDMRTLRGYIREANLFRENAAGSIDL